MREILFRGKQIDTGVWVEGFFCNENCDSVFSLMYEQANIIKKGTGYWYSVIPNTVGQYTGLTDKNGKRIFEGDILQYKNETCWVINWCAEETRFVVTGYIDGKKCEHICIDTVFRDFEVIGNIHDNPELLKR